METATKLRALTETVTITQATHAWLKEMYRAGAVKFASGTPELDPRVRTAITAIHSELAAGNKHIFTKLEGLFDAAWSQAEESVYENTSPILPLTP